MIEKTVVVGPFQCNCRLFACSRTGEAILVDPGDDAGQIIQQVQAQKLPNGQPLQVRYLLHTHAHLDHIGATREVQKGLGAEPKIALHRDDEPLYLNLKMQGRLFGINYDDPAPIQHYLQHEEEMRLGDLKLTFIHTPGHSPGSLCIRIHENAASQIPEMVLTGDTLFQGSVGRTDLWGADQDLMFKNIRNRLLTLDDDTRVCPGHGPDSWIGIEKRENPFLS